MTCCVIIHLMNKLKKYLKIKKLIQELEKKSEALRTEIVAKGSHEEGNFVAKVSTETRRSIGVLEIQKGYPDIYEELTKRNLVKETTFQKVKIEVLP